MKHLEQIILWLVLLGLCWPCVCLLVVEWIDRPKTMRHPVHGHYVSVRSWQKEMGYDAR